MKKLKPYLWKLAWVVGLFLLTIISFDIQKQIDSYSNSMFSLKPSYSAHILIHFMWGVYLSLLFIKKWTIRINLPLFLCVFLPCFLFSLILPVSMFTPISFPGGVWFIKVASSGLIEIVAGLTLLLSIFDNKKSAS